MVAILVRGVMRFLVRVSRSSVLRVSWVSVLSTIAPVVITILSILWVARVGWRVAIVAILVLVVVVPVVAVVGIMFLLSRGSLAPVLIIAKPIRSNFVSIPIIPPNTTILPSSISPISPIPRAAVTISTIHATRGECLLGGNAFLHLRPVIQLPNY
jgi:hypothetical protein